MHRHLRWQKSAKKEEADKIHIDSSMNGTSRRFFLRSMPLFMSSHIDSFHSCERVAFIFFVFWFARPINIHTSFIHPNSIYVNYSEIMTEISSKQLSIQRHAMKNDAKKEKMSKQFREEEDMHRFRPEINLIKYAMILHAIMRPSLGACVCLWANTAKKLLKFICWNSTQFDEEQFSSAFCCIGKAIFAENSLKSDYAHANVVHKMQFLILHKMMKIHWQSHQTQRQHNLDLFSMFRSNDIPQNFLVWISVNEMSDQRHLSKNFSVHLFLLKRALCSMPFIHSSTTWWRASKRNGKSLFF